MKSTIGVKSNQRLDGSFNQDVLSVHSDMYLELGGGISRMQYYLTECRMWKRTEEDLMVLTFAPYVRPFTMAGSGFIKFVVV